MQNNAMVSYNVRVALIIFSEHNIKLALAFLKPRASCDIFSPSLSSLYYSLGGTKFSRREILASSITKRMRQR